MEKYKLPLSALCLLLVVGSGCNTTKTRPPVAAIILVPGPDDEPAVYTEQGGRLEFRSEAPDFTVTISDPNLCKEGTSLSGKSGQPAVCSLAPDAKSGKYGYTISVSGGAVAESNAGVGDSSNNPGARKKRNPFEGTMYVRGCNPPCKP